MKATLEFDLDYRDEKDGSDQDALDHAVHADDMYYVVWEFLHNFGRWVEYTDKEAELLSAIKEYLRDELSARGVVMD